MAERSFPGFWQGVGELAKLFIALNAGTFVFWTICKMAGLSEHEAQMAGSMLGALAAYGIVLKQALRYQGRRLRHSVSFRAPSPAVWAGLLPAVLGLLVILSELDNLIRSAFPLPKALAEAATSLSRQSAEPWLVALTVLLVLPLTEEIFFRGFMLGGFLERYSVSMAIAGSAFLYAVFQLNPWQWLPDFGLGLFLAWVAWVSRSIWPAVVGNALAHGIPLLMTSTGWRVAGFNAPYSRAVQFQPLWFDGLGASLFIAGMAALTLTWYLSSGRGGVGKNELERPVD